MATSQGRLTLPCVPYQSSIQKHIDVKYVGLNGEEKERERAEQLVRHLVANRLGEQVQGPINGSWISIFM